MAASGLGALGMIFELGAGLAVPGIPAWPVMVSVALSTAIFVWFWRHPRTSGRAASAAFVLNAAAISFALSIRDPYYARAGDWMPFQANKLGCIVAALLAPRLLSGLLAIGVHAGSGVLVLATLSPGLRDHVTMEPAATLAFAFVGVWLVFYRQRRLKLEREIATTRADIIATQRLSRMVLAIRDLANTPIQTIQLCVEILRVQGVRSDPLARIQRSIARLSYLNKVLERYGTGMVWRDNDTSIDALSELEEEVSDQDPATGLRGS